MERDLLRTLLMLANGNHNVLDTHCQMLVVGKYICQKDEYAGKPVYQVTTRGELLIRALEDVAPPGPPPTHSRKDKHGAGFQSTRWPCRASLAPYARGRVWHNRDSDTQAPRCRPRLLSIRAGRARMAKAP